MIEREQRRRASGFTLVELLIVVVILGILAAVAVPQFVDSQAESKEAALKAQLAIMRSAIERYRVAHLDKYPGYPAGGGIPEKELFRKQLVRNTKITGEHAKLGTPGYPLGPYLIAPIPTNPVNDRRSTLIVLDGDPIPAPDDSTGWIFKPQTGELRANVSGTTSTGENFSDL